mmetsp:Transcript_25007/g.40175  ORF Transcript_25007/g.40175 Transcript_25007/m.40175 type:complete len:258 (-) Transcript_25007:61-834(-)|eukprot:CAMPEP_0169109380 /NCGR_PEP_ID=MMETSP1015-20121227/25935_1 /TAXON_ID=342587 /ORGANISM="Karlodinium micrum, Strain CCMP2283" /LENGTH=257 /DNA_ID=CAMNT_0009171075 /DNA_START=42 /DNA_END=815 /DNA_ORIENTATION=-
MAGKAFATIAAAILIVANFADARRVQTEILIQHPIHANSQPLDDKSSSSLMQTAASGTLEGSAAGKDEGEKSTTLWKWLSSGGPLTSLSLAISSHVLGRSTGGEAMSTDTFNERLYFFSIAIFLVASLTCSCRTVGWLRGISCNKRNQYTHRGRVIYEWVQTANAITFFTKLPPGQTQDNLEVKLWPKHARIGRKDKVPFLKEALYDAIDVDKSCWSVNRKGELVISLAKEVDKDWPCVFAAHQTDKAACDRVKRPR